MTVVDIIVNYLEENGFDGLCNPDGECGCCFCDFVPCENVEIECRPAYKVAYNDLSEDQKKYIDSDCEWCMFPEKPLLKEGKI
ncbi:MAG: hypothetical protein ISR78_04665 [Spirochaetia bacterium]|nr:hypothetical protein [Spirochaetia bacterium]